MRSTVRPEYPFDIPDNGLPIHKRPGVLASGYIIIACYLLFVFLW